MTKSQIALLLGMAAARDQRTIGDADVLAWHEDVGDLDFADARMAVSLHYRESVERLMAAHVRALVVRIHNERARRTPHEIRELPSRFEPDTERAERLERGLALARAVTAVAVRRSMPVDDDPVRERALVRARRERTTPLLEPEPKMRRPAPKDFPPPQTDDVAKLATRYLIDGHDPKAVAELLLVSRTWCRQTAGRFRQPTDPRGTTNPERITPA